ncbi:MAG TPA: hypothetical protein VFZ78_01805 [Flavisolibacter sp.]
MNRTIVERNLVVVLFILVLVIFSFAERDSRKLVPLYAGDDNVPTALLPAAPSTTEAAPAN